ncbi:hypothetical protein FOZ60_000723 [Perkinsus olseni]|uniref:Uncharacterized protein n=1 Tax=Perkinsus olseni TaxID=32597 RepID=A0A7J6P1U2_PEROL|nr:hypothetical protein FOZ60_000723 [Perkinsus olseni]
MARVDRARISIEDLEGKADVGDKTWEMVSVALGAAKDCIPLIPNFAFVNAESVTTAVNFLDNAVQKGKVMLLYDLCREHCGLQMASHTTMNAGVRSPAHWVNST